MSFMEAEGMGHSAPPDKVGIFCRHTAQPALSVRARVPRAAFAGRLREALQELRRLAPSGRAEERGEIPFIAYLDLTPESVAFEVGLPLAKNSVRMRGDSLNSVPMGRYVSVSETLTAGAVVRAYQKLADWSVQQKEHCTGPTYTTLAPGAGANETTFLLQRKICAGSYPDDESCARVSLLSPEAGALAQIGLELLMQERACN